jgi:hypothetical protein
MQQQQDQQTPSAPSFSDYRMDSVRNLRPSSSRSLQSVPSSQEYDPERTTFINPLGKFLNTNACETLSKTPF